MSTRNPIKDRTAIVGVGTTPFARDGGGRSAQSLAIKACVKAVRDAGLNKDDIDGLCGAAPHQMQGALGIRECTWWASPGIPFIFQIVAAMNAVNAGSCDVALAYHSVYRNPGTSRQAARDPFRRRMMFGFGGGGGAGRDSVGGVVGYAAWASRYFHEFSLRREHLGYIAINSRTNAAQNEHAVMRTPLSMQDYLDARMVREPLCIFDMEPDGKLNGEDIGPWVEALLP